METKLNFFWPKDF